MVDFFIKKIYNLKHIKSTEISMNFCAEIQSNRGGNKK